MNKYLFLGFLALVISIGAFIFTAEPLSYMSTEASTCNNCHVMETAYENWYHGPHQKVTECVDCHLPHDNLINYWFQKGKTGLHDVFYFSAGLTPELIRAKPEAQEIIQANCIRCHKETVEAIIMGPQAFDRHCWDCHRTVAHGNRGVAIGTYQDSVIYPVK